MKLSEAILLSIGVVRNEQMQYLNLNGYADKPGPCGCAIGTALYSIGLRKRLGYAEKYHEAIEHHWPWTIKDNIAVQISERHVMGESRESIAAWIATIEPQEGTCLEDISIEQQTQEKSGVPVDDSSSAVE